MGSSQSQCVDNDHQWQDLLITGYLRHTDKCNVIQDIILLCIAYFYHNDRILFYLANNHSIPLSFKFRQPRQCYYRNLNTSDAGNIFIYELNTITKTDSTTLYQSKWRIDSSSLCTARNIKLPNSISKKIASKYKSHCKSNKTKLSLCNRYMIIFKRPSGSWNKTDLNKDDKRSFAIAFDEMELTKSMLEGINDVQTIIGFKWDLPNLPVIHSEFVYSQHYGLLAVGGVYPVKNLPSCNKIYCLSFDDESYFKQNKHWKWTEIADMRSTNIPAAVIMLSDTQLFIFRSSAESEVIDLETQQSEFIDHALDRDGGTRSLGILPGICAGDENKIFIVDCNIMLMYDIGNSNSLEHSKGYKFRSDPLLNVEQVSPAVWLEDNELFVATGEEILYSLDLRKDSIVWKRKPLVLSWGKDWDGESCRQIECVLSGYRVVSS